MELVDGAQWRERREWERLAWQTAYLLQPFSRHAPQPRDLLADVFPDTGDRLDAVLGKSAAWNEAVDLMLQRQAAARKAGNGDR